MSTNESVAGAAAGGVPVAKEAPTEQQSSQGGAPQRVTGGRTVCNQKNEKGKLCNGHLKQTNTAGEDALKHLRGEDVFYKCQTCGTLYMGPPLGHVRDPRKQTRFVERELMDILNAAGGTLPAFKLNERGAYVPAAETAHGATAKPAATPAAKPATSAPAAAASAPQPAAPEETPEQKRARKLAEAAARKATAVPIPGAAGPPPEGETPEQKLARLRAVVAEAKRRKEASGGAPSVDAAPTSPPPPSPTSGTDSSASADAHRPAAEAQAATGMASAVPLSPAAATASPAAGAETAADLAPDASTELTPGAPKAAKAKAEGGAHSGFKVPAELLPQPGETPEQKLARLRATVEAAKRAAGKL
ncbi:MAG: hypothetical protein LC800_07125 [Acidobacteria bacterium]|nr:hypothetical protein [Acidobacteriota bacterium]